MKKILMMLLCIILSLSFALPVLADRIGVINGNTAVRNELNLNGDANRNGSVDAEDALYILKKSAKVEDAVWGQLLPDNMEWSDVDDDSILTAKDALQVLKMSAKLIPIDMKQPELNNTYYYNFPVPDDLVYPQEVLVIDSYEKVNEVKSNITTNYPEMNGKMGINFLEFIDKSFFEDKALILCIRSNITGRDYYAINSQEVEGNVLLLNMNQLWAYALRKHYDDMLNTNAYRVDDVKNRFEMIYAVVQKNDVKEKEIELFINKLAAEDEVDTDLYVAPTPAPGGDEWYYDMINQEQGDY